LIPVFTPFDYILFSQGYAITFDAKTVDANTFSYSQIEKHQVASLSRAAENALRSGYLIWFRPLDLVSFIPVSTLKTVKPRQSVTPEHGIIIGKGSGFNLQMLFEMKEINSHLIYEQHLPIE
jgi:penicillin-binding protein-related factor A (putative recombinase)